MRSRQTSFTLFKKPRRLAASELWAKDNKDLILENVDSDVENRVGGHFAAVRLELFKGVDEDVRDHYEKLAKVAPPAVDIEAAIERCIQQCRLSRMQTDGPT